MAMNNDAESSPNPLCLVFAGMYIDIFGISTIYRWCRLLSIGKISSHTRPYWSWNLHSVIVVVSWWVIPKRSGKQWHQHSGDNALVNKCVASNGNDSGTRNVDSLRIRTTPVITGFF